MQRMGVATPTHDHDRVLPGPIRLKFVQKMMHDISGYMTKTNALWNRELVNHWTHRCRHVNAMLIMEREMTVLMDAQKGKLDELMDEFSAELLGLRARPAVGSDDDETEQYDGATNAATDGSDDEETEQDDATAVGSMRRTASSARPPKRQRAD